MKELFGNLYSYRQLLKSNVKKEVRGKYKGSFLGILWSFINPLLAALVYAIVFPIILKQSEPNYVTYIIIGILPWTYFITVITQGTITVLANAGIIKKVYFPKEILPISVNASATINFLISCLIIFIFLIFSGIGFNWYIIFLPLIILVQFILQQGIIFITSAIHIYIRDLEHIITFFLNMLFYATPILYSPTLFETSNLKWIIKVNPMAIIINCYHDVLYYKSMPHVKSLLIVLLISIILCYVGFKIFKKLEKGFAEEV